MATKVSASKQLEAAARLAIGALAIGSAERIALARALNAIGKAPVRASNPGSRKKYVYVVDHSINCYCVACKPNRDNEAAACALQTGLMLAAGTIGVWSATAAGKLDYKWADVEYLKYCACSHIATAHAKDSNENLLKCEATDCECDHFHYQIEEKEAA